MSVGQGRRPAPLTRTPESTSRVVPREASQARAHELVEGVWALQLPVAYESVTSVNAYLLAAGGGHILVDCGSCLAPGWDALEVALRGAGAEPSGVHTLVPTHSHTDHRGLAAEVRARTGATVAMGPGPHPIIDILRDPAIPLETREATARREGVEEIAMVRMTDELPGGERVYPHAEPSVTLEDGDTLESDTGPWEVRPAPGHSADMIMLWNARLRWLLSTDLALPGPAGFIEYGTRPDPHADQIASLGRALEYEPELLLGGHGRPIPDGTAFLTRCREKTVRRLERLAGELGETPLSGWELTVLRLGHEAKADLYQRVLSETLCVLEHLEAHARARSLSGDDGVRRWVAA